MGDRLGFGTKGRRQGGEGDAVLAQVGRGRIREEDSDGRECHKIIFAGPEDGPLQSFTGPWLGVPIPDARRAGSRGSPFGSLQGYNYNLNPPSLRRRLGERRRPCLRRRRASPGATAASLAFLSGSDTIVYNYVCMY
jgi:hypothetical protein